MAGFILQRVLAATQQQLSAHEIPLTKQEAVSGMLGSISLVSWIFLLIPQLIENYRCGSADGVSIVFLLVWFAGDVANLAGALWAHLVPTVIAIAVYFCFSDITLVAQCTYYNYINARREKQAYLDAQGRSQSAATDGTEEEPLLSRRDSNQSFGLPGSHRRRRSSAVSGRRSTTGEEGATAPTSMLTKITEEDVLSSKGSSAREWIKNIICILLICLIGVAAWAVAWKIGAWKPSPVPGQEPNDDKEGLKTNATPVGAEILGYISAVLYLGARIPQIIKNWREQSCEGLSLLFFLLSLLGNLTYGAGILAHSVEKEYFLTNLPWLIGSLGTMVEDVAIFIQFRLYSEEPSKNQPATTSEAIE